MDYHYPRIITRKIPYPHPGEILLQDFLKPMGITQYRLAKEIAVAQRRIGEIAAGIRGVTADTGLSLSHWYVRRFLDYSARCDPKEGQS